VKRASCRIAEAVARFRTSRERGLKVRRLIAAVDAPTTCQTARPDLNARRFPWYINDTVCDSLEYEWRHVAGIGIEEIS
jgi:hypothetical protein